MQVHTVSFLPDNRKVRVNAGTDLLRAAAMAGIELKSVCGGEGTCGRCAVAIREGKALVGEGNLSRRFRELGYVLACRTVIQGDLVVEVPPETRLGEHQVLLDRIEKREVLAEEETGAQARYPLSPVTHRLTLRLDPPTLTENASDLSRLSMALKKAGGLSDVTVGLDTLRRLPSVLRDGEWEVTATFARVDGRAEVVAVEPGRGGQGLYGLAIDIGTTTVVVLLVDLETGATVDRRGTYNKQFRYGDDVITRIIHAGEAGGLGRLQGAVLETIEELVASIVKKNRIARDDIRSVVVAGNTTMSHLFLGIPPEYIRLEPYIPAAASFPAVKARELGLAVHSLAPVITFPAVASYVGGDIVAGVLVTGITRADEVSLFIDIGTNGEIVLGNRDWLVACACSAGPAFEGGGITCGMRAMPGAIQRLEIDGVSHEVTVSTVGGEKPVGICGTGLVDGLAKMREAGIIDRAGKFQPSRSPRYRETAEGPEFVLAWADEAGGDRDVVITENDVKNLLRAKGAVYAGIRSLLQTVDLPLEAIDRIYIAGGFGNYLNVRDAVEIGLLPDVPLERYSFVGNTSVKGARLGLLSREALQEAEELARKMTYLELSAGNKFMEEFMSAIFLPHTDLSLFPSVAR